MGNETFYGDGLREKTSKKSEPSQSFFRILVI